MGEHFSQTGNLARLTGPHLLVNPEDTFFVLDRMNSQCGGIKELADADGSVLKFRNRRLRLLSCVNVSRDFRGATCRRHQPPARLGTSCNQILIPFVHRFRRARIQAEAKE